MRYGGWLLLMDKKSTEISLYFFITISLTQTSSGLHPPKIRIGEPKAERQGFEPQEPAKAQRFSRPSHSTALASLQKLNYQFIIDMRRGRDSNPWYALTHNTLAGCPFQPLRHLSKYIFNFNFNFSLPLPVLRNNSSLLASVLSIKAS